MVWHHEQWSHTEKDTPGAFSLVLASIMAVSSDVMEGWHTGSPFTGSGCRTSRDFLISPMVGEATWDVRLSTLKHESHRHTCSEVLVHCNNTIHNLLWVRLRVYDRALAWPSEIFWACKMRHESGQNNQLMEEGAWMLIILFPAIHPTWHDKQSKWMNVK